MSFSRTCRAPDGGGGYRYCYRSNSFNRSSTATAAKDNAITTTTTTTSNNNNNEGASREISWRHRERLVSNAAADALPPLKRRRSGVPMREDGAGRYYHHPNSVVSSNGPSTSTSSYREPVRHDAGPGVALPTNNKQFEQTKLEQDVVFLSRDEIERCSPSRKDGIDLLRETHLRYSYCAFLRNLGMRLDLPQTTIGTSMVLCHRFFVHRSHACHDKFLIATAALFLAAKSEETQRPLNNVLRASCEIYQNQIFSFFPYLLPGDWFEQYRELVIEAEQMILTTLDFELNVQHPYVPLTSVLNKLGLSQTVLVNLAWNLVSEGLRSSLWLQFKPHHIAAGAAFLAAKFLNFDLAPYQSIWHEFQTTPSILQDVVKQLMELL